MANPSGVDKSSALARGASCEVCPLKDRPWADSKSEMHPQLAIVSKHPGEEEVEKGEILVGNTGRKIRKALHVMGILPKAVHFNNLVLCRPLLGAKAAEINAAIECCKPRLAKDLEGIPVVLCADGKVNQQFTGKMNEMDWFGHGLPATLIQGKGKKAQTLWTGRAMPAFQPAKAFHKPSLWPVFYTCMSRAWEMAQGQGLTWKPPEIVFGTDLEVFEALAELAKAPMLGVDIENTGDPLKAPITAIGIAMVNGPWVSVNWIAADNALKETVKNILESGIPLVFHNGAFDIAALEEMAGIKCANFAHDTMFMHTAACPDASHKLSFVAACLFDRPRWKSIFGDHKDEKGGPGSERWKRVDDELLIYNATDAGTTLDIAELYLATLDTRALSFASTLVKLSLLGLQMQGRGVAIDAKVVERHWEELGLLVDTKRAQLCQLARLVGRVDYNPDSGLQNRDLFFEVLRVPPTYWSKKTHEAALHEKALTHIAGTEIGAAHELAVGLLEYRSNSVLRRNTVAAMKGLSKIHPTPKVNGGGATGRWSYKPAMQNWQKPLRDMIVARPGFYLLEADKKQLEARVAAALNQEPKLLAAIDLGLNIHKFNLKNIFGEKAVGNAELYKLVKTLFFAALYLASPRTIWENVRAKGQDIPIRDVIRFVDAMFTAYPRLKQGPMERVRQAWKDDYIEIPGSRHRYYLYGEPPSPNLCANIPVQGFGAHRMNTEGLELQKRLDWINDFMLLQVHDAFIFETRNPIALAGIIRDVMDKPVDFGNGVTIPLPVEMKLGRNWYEMKAFDTPEEQALALKELPL